MHARIQIYWCTSSIFRHLKLELLTQFPASNDEKYINVVYIWRKFVSFYGYVHWRMTTEISVMYGSEKIPVLWLPPTDSGMRFTLTSLRTTIVVFNLFYSPIKGSYKAKKKSKLPKKISFREKIENLKNKHIYTCIYTLLKVVKVIIWHKVFCPCRGLVCKKKKMGRGVGEFLF